jgi:hypothetical protein
MRNPAWRPAQLSTERLASIQRHLIDERPVVPGTGKPGSARILPVHMAITPGYPADALQPDYLMETLARQLNTQATTDGACPAWHLEAVPLERDETTAGTGFNLVFATASLEGVRLAYARIKRLSVNPSRRFGVLFGGARDGEIAQCCQERLASGAGQFLGIRLYKLGHLPAPGPGCSAELAHVAGEVHRLWVAYSYLDQMEVNHS